MAFGNFTLTGQFFQLDGVTPATGRVQIDGIPQVIIDTGSNKIRVGPRTVTLDTQGAFSINLPSDATTGNSTGIAFRVTPTLKHQALAPTEFYARAIGSTVDLKSITTQQIVALTPAGVSQADFNAYVASNSSGSNFAISAVDTTKTASATLTANHHTPVDATAAARTMTLPTTAAVGALLSVEKTDASTNTVTVTGTLRGVASQSIPLTTQYEARTFLSEGAGSWRPVSDHRTAASLDTRYASTTAVPALYGQTFDRVSDPAMLNGRAAIANWENAKAKILFIGDSLTYGFNVTAQTKRFASVATRQIRSRLGNAPGLEFLAAGREPTATYPNPWTYSAGLATFSSFGPGRQAIALQAAGQSISKTVHGNRMDVWTTKLNPGGHLSVKVAGTEVADIDTTSALVSDGQVTTITLGPVADYAVSLEWKSGGRVEVGGIDVYDDTNQNVGIHSYIAGRFGWTTTNYATPSVSDYGKAFQAVNPNVVVYCLAVNDYSNNIDPATTDANIRAQLAAMRTLFTSAPSFVLVPVWLRTGSFTFPWQQYVDKMTKIASDFPGDTALLDMSVRFPSVASDTRGLYSDQVHLTDKGAALFGSTIGQFLMPR